jgi:protein involved in polysaccharide export with SLBB domain
MFIFEIVHSCAHTAAFRYLPMRQTLQRIRFFLLQLALLACVCGPAHADKVDASPTPVERAEAVSSATPDTVVYASTDSLDDKRKLTIGDHVSYRVIEDKNPAVDLTVTDAGDLEIPLLGRVSAAGKTCRQLAYEMKPVLEKTYFYKATVIVALDAASQKSPGRVYVSGFVVSPGPQEMPPDEVYTLSRAITRAGGVAQFGNDRRVKIVRKAADGTTQTQEVDVGEIINKGRIDKDPVLLPEDMIVVPRKLINF